MLFGEPLADLSNLAISSLISIPCGSDPRERLRSTRSNECSSCITLIDDSAVKLGWWRRSAVVSTRGGDMKQCPTGSAWGSGASEQNLTLGARSVGQLWVRLRSISPLNANGCEGWFADLR